MARLESLWQAARPSRLEAVAPYRAWRGLAEDDPNMRRALVRRERCVSLVYVLPDSSTPPGALPSRWSLAGFGPGYGALITPALNALWRAYAAQSERQLQLEAVVELGVTALLVSSDEAHRLVLLFVTLEPRDDRRFWPARKGRPVE
jgi:hypothetical protein